MKDRRDGWICFALASVCLLIYVQTAGFDFINYDDPLYITQNPDVLGGVTLEGLERAFVSNRAEYFHPITWISHMIDCEVFGLNAGAHHLENAFLHALNAILLFLLLRRLTGRVAGSALAAALFAVHPFNVESVAWVTERKNLLSMLFFIVSVFAYAWYVKRPSLKRNGVVAVCFALGLMAKPMLVTFPFLMMVLDFWPFQRYHGAQKLLDAGKRFLVLLAEKTPLFMLSILVCILTYLMQAAGGGLVDEKMIPFSMRLSNAPVAYAIYVLKGICPVGLTLFYPHPMAMRPLWQVGGALGLLSAISIVVLVFWRTRPYLIVGWLWFLGTLVPMIELVQAGAPIAYADRYTYLPLVGLFIMAAFLVEDVAASGRIPRRAIRGASLGAIIILAALSFNQTRPWRDSITLFEYTLRVNPNCVPAHNNLGVALRQLGKFEESKKHFNAILEMNTIYKVAAHMNLGQIAAMQKDFAEAEKQFATVIAGLPSHVPAHLCLGQAFLDTGEKSKGIAEFEQALALDEKNPIAKETLQQMGVTDPDLVGAHCALGKEFAAAQAIDLAQGEFNRAAAIAPADPRPHYQMGVLLALSGRPQDAVPYFTKVLELQPQNVDALTNLGMAFAMQGKLDDATTRFRQALALEPDHTGALYDLACTLDQQGKKDEAAAQYEALLRITPDDALARNALEKLRNKP